MAPICFFLLFLWDYALDKRPSGNDQLYWILPDGDAQDSRSFGAILCFYLGTFRPLLLCWARPKGEGAIKPAASFKRSGRPIDATFSKIHLDKSTTSALCLKSQPKKHNVTSARHFSHFYLVFLIPDCSRKRKRLRTAASPPCSPCKSPDGGDTVPQHHHYHF